MSEQMNAYVTDVLKVLLLDTMPNPLIEWMNLCLYPIHSPLCLADYTSSLKHSKHPLNPKPWGRCSEYRDE